jgi:hypothetical protein
MVDAGDMLLIWRLCEGWGMEELSLRYDSLVFYRLAWRGWWGCG